MIYAILEKKQDECIRKESQACVRRGSPVWRTFREARIWRDSNDSDKGIFVVLADWEEDTELSDSPDYRILCDVFKLIQVEGVIPEWIKAISKKVAEEAWDEGLLEEGFINPDYATPEQELVYYDKHRDEVMFQIRCLTSLAIFEELESQGFLDARNERRGNERQDSGSSD